MSPSDFAQLVEARRRRGERLLLLLHGDTRWQAQMLASLALSSAARVGNRDATAGNARQAAAFLGASVGALVVDLVESLDADRIAAGIGAVAAGGIIVVLLPSERLQNGLADRIAATLQQSDIPLSLSQGVDEPSAFAALNTRIQPAKPELLGPVKVSQQVVTSRMTHAVRRGVPVLLLSGGRGRGKSTTLGQWLQARPVNEQWTVTAPRRAAAAAILRQNPRLPYSPVDELLNLPIGGGGRLVIDEAASIGAASLMALIQRFSTVVLCSTTDGYEGAGQSLALKLIPWLQQQRVEIAQFELSLPVRWLPDDPIEPLFNQLFLLTSDGLPQLAPRSVRMAVEAVSAEQLQQDSAMLRAVFDLLRLGHYRTSPADLALLLDDQQSRLVVAREGDDVVGVCLLIAEGGIDDAQLALAIRRGQRRPAGNLVPQSLAFHGGRVEALGLGYWRISRIVCHPQRRGQGVAGAMLTWLAEDFQPQSDALSVSFGLEPGLLRFWLRHGFRLVRIGSRRNSISGRHSAIMLRPATPAATSLADNAEQRLAQEWRWLRAGALASIDADCLALIEAALAGCGSGLLEPGRLFEFAHFQAPLEACLPELNQWLTTRIEAQNALSAHLIEARDAGWQLGRLAQLLALPGVKDAERWLRTTIRETLPAGAGSDVRGF